MEQPVLYIVIFYLNLPRGHKGTSHSNVSILVHKVVILTVKS